ncbi:hypothetical protein ACP4OV_006842 [Aristida adscensionis]
MGYLMLQMVDLRLEAGERGAEKLGGHVERGAEQHDARGGKDQRYRWVDVAAGDVQPLTTANGEGEPPLVREGDEGDDKWGLRVSD